MNHRVVVDLILGVRPHDFSNVSGLKSSNQIVNNPRYPIIDVKTGDTLEYLAQERIGLWYQRRRFHSREVIWRGIVKPGRKHAVGDCLSVDVGESIRCKVVNQNLLESLILAL